MLSAIVVELGAIETAPKAKKSVVILITMLIALISVIWVARVYIVIRLS